jgi:hypothetical protein
MRVGSGGSANAASPGRHWDVNKSTTILIGQAAIEKFALPASALAAALVGTSVYLLDRDWAGVLFLAPYAASQGEQFELFGAFGYVLPAFCHAYAFALLLILALGRSRRARILGALAWFAVAACLEVLQSPQISALLPSMVIWQTDSPLLGSIIDYAVNGRFDTYDLAAAGLGCVTAWFVASIPEERT